MDFIQYLQFIHSIFAIENVNIIFFSRIFVVLILGLAEA